MAKDHKPGLAVIIGLGRPRGAAPPVPASMSGAKGPARMSPISSGGPNDGDNDEDDAAGSQNQQKVTPVDAHCFTPEYRCSSCEHYIHPSHECMKVAGNDFGIGITGCVDYWEPVSPGGGGATGGAPGVPASGPQVDVNQTPGGGQNGF